MNAKEMWERYSARNNINADFQAWQFGSDPDELARLVLEGTKTGTASLHLWYAMEGLEFPRAGEYSVVLNAKREAVCIIKTTKVYIVHFCEVGEAHAFKEGEGDRSLAYWRTVHEDFFKRELEEAGLTFEENMEVVCEEFIRIFP